MGYKRSSWLAYVSTLLVILKAAVQECEGLPGQVGPKDDNSGERPKPCLGSRCPSNVCRTQGLNCCQCKPLTSTSQIEICACCPSGYSCCPNTAPSLHPTCCPAGWKCDREMGGCTRVIPSSPSNSLCSPCDRMYLSITADDKINDLYIDGISYTNLVTTLNTWTNVRTFEIPGDTKVIATNCSDTQKVVAGLLASTTNNYLNTNSAWKCTTKKYANWMQTLFDDRSSPNTWPNAVPDHLNDGSGIHYQLNQISSTATWVWTTNYGQSSSIDTPVYCRGYFPAADCNIQYGNFTNLCARQRKTCCGCELSGLGPTMMCNCCPGDYRCCPSSTPNGRPTCCPRRSTCRRDGQCLVTGDQVSALTSCSNCESRDVPQPDDPKPENETDVGDSPLDVEPTVEEIDSSLDGSSALEDSELYANDGPSSGLSGQADLDE